MKLNRVVNNAKWIIVCKIAQSILQLVVGMICARYLGPSNYGLINYVASVTAFVLPIMKLGFDAILVYELVEQPEKEGEIIGTSLTLNVISAFLCWCGVTAFVAISNPNDSQVVIVCLLHSFAMIFGAMELVQYWFQYKLLSKYTSIIMLVAYFVAAVYKIIITIMGCNIYWFAAANPLDYAIIGLSIVALYLKKGSRLTFSFDRARKMFSRSKHYILAAMMLVILQNTDHIMITTMISKKENGFYSAAITCATVVQFVYLAIIDSFRPVILENKNKDIDEYELNVSRLYGITVYMSIAQSIIFTVFSSLIIYILYGKDYMAAAPVLQILTWYCAFSFMGTVRNIWLLAEEKQKYLWRINLSGAVLNVIVNYILIPYWGACGAAFASLLTQFFMNFILGFIMKPIRENNRLLMRGINPKFFMGELKKIINMLLCKKQHN